MRTRSLLGSSAVLFFMAMVGGGLSLRAEDSPVVKAKKIYRARRKGGCREPGKDADILVLRRHPFKTPSFAEAVFIKVKTAFKRKRGDHL